MASEKAETIETKRQVDEQLKQDQARAAETVEAGKPAESKAEEKPKATAKKQEGKEEKRKIILERLYVAPLSKAYAKPRSHRARIALSILRQFASRHAKVEVDRVKIASSVNSFIQAQGARNPPKSVRVKVTKDDKGFVNVELAEESAAKAQAKLQARKDKRAAVKAAKPKPAAKPKEAKAAKPAAKPSAPKA
jgi:large subunit ribosomal protein L31e